MNSLSASSMNYEFGPTASVSAKLKNAAIAGTGDGNRRGSRSKNPTASGVDGSPYSREGSANEEGGEWNTILIYHASNIKILCENINEMK